MSIDAPNYDDIHKAITKLLRRLYHEGKIQLKEDHRLTNGALEIRVEQIFKLIGFDIREGRQKNLEDFIVYPSDEFKTLSPLAIEVKSGKSSCIARDDLRQLDDWVFELSGEEKIRKLRPSNFKPNTFYITAGLPPGPDTHPTPHKGVLIYNGPLGVQFNDRPQNCIHTNDIEYVEKRFFCILSLQTLTKVYDQFVKGELNKKQIWESIHNSSGLWEQDKC